jgi:hypothetical protein
MSFRKEGALDIMRSADAEPNIGKASSGHDCYRLFRVADRSADHDRRFLSATFRRESEGQTGWLPQLPSKERWYFQVAQTIRASRLARATVALL